MANDIVFNVVANSQTFESGVCEAANAAKQFQDNLTKAEKQEEQNRARSLERLRAYNQRSYDQALADARNHVENMNRVWSRLSESGPRPSGLPARGRQSGNSGTDQTRNLVSSRPELSLSVGDSNRSRNIEPWREADLDRRRSRLAATRDQEIAVEQAFIERRESLTAQAEERETRIRQSALERRRASLTRDREQLFAWEQLMIERRESLAAQAEDKESRLRESILARKRAAYVRDREQQISIEQAAVERRESLTEQAEAKEYANRQNGLERQRSLNAANLAKRLAEEQRIFERNEQAAANVRRSLMTPRDFVTQDILAAKAAWKSGELDAKHYFDFVALQKQRLLQMNADTKLGYTGYGGRGARVTQQLAFGLEDFATQYGTMGMIGGIRAASNNISAAGMMFSAPVGIAASLASTLTMLGIAAWESSKKLQEHKKSLKDLEQEYNSLEKIVERAHKYLDYEREVSRVPKMKSSGEVSSRVSDLEHERKKIEDEIHKRQEAAARLLDESISLKVKTRSIEMNQSLDLGSATDESGYLNLEQLEKNRQAFLEEIDKLREIQRKTIAEKVKLDAALVTDPKQSETFRKQQLELDDLNASLERNIRLRQELEPQLAKSSIEENEKRVAELQSKRFKEESDHLEEVAELREKERQQVEEFRKKYQTPREKYKEEMDRIAEMRRIGLDEPSALRAEKNAAAELRDSLGGSRVESITDARGANARSGFEAALRSYMQTVPKAQTSPPPTQAEKEQIDLLKNSYKQLQELGRVLQKNLTSENLGLVMEVLNF